MTQVRHWPAAQPPSAEERVETRCPGCRTRWNVHRDMAGFRLRCECGSWVPVPRLFGLALPIGARAAALAAPGGAGAGPLVPLGAPASLTRAALAPGALRHASVDERRAWTGRSLFEMIALVLALAGPATLVHLSYTGAAAAAAMPLASLASGVLVLLLCATMGAYAFSGLRDAKPLAYMEALAVAAGTAGLALAWTQWLAGYYPGLADPLLEMRHTIGLGWSLFVVGLCPAIFEELAFRGLLQGRLMALLGKSTGIVVTAAAFALAHGVTTGLPFHFFLGLYLGFLRERTGSLYPGMLLHLVYNSILVCLVI